MQNNNAEKLPVCFLIYSLIILCSCSSNDSNIEYNYSNTKHTLENGHVNWNFRTNPAPPLNLKNDSLFVRDVNTVLKKIGIDTITQRVEEKSKITGSRYDRGVYEWSSHPLGVLSVYRNSSWDDTSWDSDRHHYDCIWTVSIE